jgi:hypothetical protein
MMIEVVKLLQIVAQETVTPNLLVKYIGVLQHQTKHENCKKALFVQMLSDKVLKSGAIAWDDNRGLFWVNHPVEGWQVATWLMDEAIQITGP